ncbi:MAG: UDP-N-acetylmuramoyl-tripeptide--D-alanyl-D-alanine ligase, partial [Acidobacteria bacterium]|nr:UDP-N-acetylmuramoyl-tripeptide--D-alanyl-D-alanine ligase [Acidobacteriota bacterium]
ADDPRIMSRAHVFAGRTVTFGVRSDADVQASEVRMRGLDGFSASVRTPAGALQLDTSLLGTGNLSNVLAATAVAVTFDVPLDAIASRVSALRPARRRGELLRLPGGVTLIDDSYNSSPTALKHSLEVVAAATGSARKVAVLGEMLELGEYGSLLHGECGQAAKDAGLDCLFVVGGAAAGELADAARKAGMPAGSIVFTSNREEALTELLKRVRPGDLVLVKGSRGIGLDVVVDRLKAEFA